MRPPTWAAVSPPFRPLIVSIHSLVLFTLSMPNLVHLPPSPGEEYNFLHQLDSCCVFTLKVRKYFAVIFEEERKVKLSPPHPQLTPGTRIYQSERSNWQMKGIERYKAIHIFSDPSAGYLALIMRCRFYFLLLQTTRCAAFYAIMLPHAGVIYHANALCYFHEETIWKKRDTSTHIPPPVRAASGRHLIQIAEEDTKPSPCLDTKLVSAYRPRKLLLIRNTVSWVNGFSL